MHRRARRNVRIRMKMQSGNHLECDNKRTRYFCGTIIIIDEESSRCNALELRCIVAFSAREAASTRITDYRRCLV